MKPSLLRATSAMILAACAAPAFGQTPAVVQTAPPPVKEAEKTDRVVVTGSLLQRSDYQLTSPVDVVGRADLDAKAPTTVADFVKDLPYNFGSAFASGRAFGNERGAGTINLRGLGASATLVLVNGRRQTQLPDAADNVVDVNSLIPEIMIDRMEILKDGASATYGSDAIAGVVNFITNDRFNGFKVTGRYNQFTYSDAADYRIEGMWGGNLGMNGHITAAFGYYDQDPINGYSYTTPSQEGTAGNIRFSSAQSNPGEFVLPTRNAAGALTTTRISNVVDPLCGVVNSSIPALTPPNSSTFPTATPTAATATDCRYFFWGDNGSQSEIRRFQGLVRAKGDISDTVHYDGEFGYANVKSRTAYTAGDTLAAAITIPGSNPGNIYYRAKDANGNPLYAVSSGVSAGFVRDGAEVFLPVRSSAGVVQLTTTPTVASSGIPFYEDISFAGRPVNSQCDLPTQNTLKDGECAWSRPSVATNNILRVAGGLNGEIGSNWTWRVGATYSRYQLDTNGTVGVALTNELNYALNGLGGTNCNRQAVASAQTPGKNGCMYFNLFGNSVFATPGTPQANSQDVINYVLPLLKDNYTSTLVTGDAVLSGELFKLPAGPVAVAVGYQIRENGLAIDYDNAANIGDKANGITQQDIDKKKTTNALFLETSVPLFKTNLIYGEATGAVRHERIGSRDTTNPKLGLRFDIADDLLSLRASYGTSFIAPSLFRTFASSAAGSAVNDCPVSQGAPCHGDTNLRIAVLTYGNPELRPEKSTSWSAGATFKPLDNLKFDIGWWKFDFSDKIATQNATAVVAANPAGTALNPVVRDATGRLTTVTTRFFNTANVVTQGIDFLADYNFDLFGGKLDLNLAGTYTPQYDLVGTPGAAVIDAAGESNDATAPAPGRTGVSPNTKLRINGTVGWRGGPHNFSAIVRYYAPIDFTLAPGTNLDAWYPVDLNYSYTFDLGSRTAMLGVGAMNIFDQEEPQVPFPGFQPFIPSLYDTRGRSVYVKGSIEF